MKPGREKRETLFLPLFFQNDSTDRKIARLFILRNVFPDLLIILFSV